MQTVRGLPESLGSLLDLMLRVAPIIQTTVIVALFLSGALLLLSAAVGVCCTAGMLHATRRPPVQDAYKYSQVKIVSAVKPAVAAPEDTLVLSLGRELECFGKGRA